MVSRFSARDVSSRHRRVGGLVCLVAVAFATWHGSSEAATWTGTSGTDWNVVGNWTSNPNGANDTVNTATGNFPVLSAAPTFTPVDLFVGTGAGNAGRLDQTSGTLALANTGVNGNWMFVGASTGTGTYNLSGDGSLAVGKLWIGGFVYGENGTGTVTVDTTGTVQANSTDDFSGWGQYQTSLSVGWGSFPSGPANGTLNVVKGTVNVPNRATYVGAWGSTGTVNQSGGTINTNGLEIGRWFSTQATVNVTGGTLNSAYVNLARTGNGGDVSKAALNVSGSGVLNSEGDFIVAVGGNGSGGSSGIVSIGTGGTVNVATTTERWLIVNQFDTTPATLTVDGGALNLNAGTDLRYSTGNSTGAGTVNLNSGSITGGAGSVVDLNRNVGTGANNAFNLNGGTLTIGQVLTSNDGSTAAFNFNGGTLKAAADSTTFFDLGGASQTANVQAGGAVIDTNGYTVTLAQPLLDAGGGLTKTGAGTLTLSGASTYSGATTVSAGRLFVGTASLATGGYTVANAADLGVVVAQANAQLTTAAITLSGSCGLDFNLGSFVNPTVAPMLTFGLTANGPVSVNVAGDRLALGQFPLLQYASRSGTGSYSLGTLPQGVTATLVDNVASQSIDLLITALASRVWNGAVSGTSNGQWSTGSQQNWLIPPSTAVAFANGDAALFDDTASGTTGVTVVGTVSPSSVTFDNSTLAYTVSGSGAIAGAIDLTKRGSASVTISSPNTYTGVTRVESGRLAVTSVANGGAASPLGAASAAASNLVITAGTFAYIGSSGTTDRGFTITGTAPSTIEVSGTSTTLTFAGLATASGTGRLLKEGDGTLRLTGSANTLGAGGLGAAVNAGRLELVGTGSDATSNVTTLTGEIAIGNVPGTGGALAMTNATLTTDWFFSIGRGTGVVGASSDVTLTNSKLNCVNLAMGYANGIPGNLGSQSLTLVDSTLTNAAGPWWWYGAYVGESGGSTASVTLLGSSTMTCGNPTLLGVGAGSVGSMVVAGSSSFSTGGWFAIGNSGNGSLTIRDSGRVTANVDVNLGDLDGGVGSISLQDNASMSAGPIYVGKRVASFGTVTISGGTLASSGVVSIASDLLGQGTWTQSAGTATAAGAVTVAGGTSSTGSMVVSGGTFSATGTTTGITVGNSGIGTLTVSGSGRVAASGSAGLVVGGLADGVGTVNLDGGVLSVHRVAAGTGTSTFTFNGGTLQAGSGASVDFMTGLGTVTVAAGGAKVDSNGQNVTIGQTLVGGTGDGGLRKLGSGTVTLSAANTYTGTTTIQAGGVRLANGAAVATSHVVPLTGGTLSLASGGLTTTVGGLSPNAGGLTDANNGSVTVAAGLPAADMLVALVTGRGDGTWNGTSGITSSQAQADLAVSVPRTVGWLDNGDGSVTFAYAAPGDTNLDWNVDILDAANFLAGGKFDSGTPATWNEGDFGYDGVVDILDAADFLSTGLFDAGAYNPPAGSAGGVAAVPEPASTAMGVAAAVIAAAVLRRRRSA